MEAVPNDCRLVFVAIIRYWSLSKSSDAEAPFAGGVSDGFEFTPPKGNLIPVYDVPKILHKFFSSIISNSKRVPKDLKQARELVFQKWGFRDL